MMFVNNELAELSQLSDSCTIIYRIDSLIVTVYVRSCLFGICFVFVCIYFLFLLTLLLPCNGEFFTRAALCCVTTNNSNGRTDGRTG